MHDGVLADAYRGIIKVDSYGKSSKEDITKAIGEIQLVSAETGFHKVMVDATKQTAMPPAADIYEVFSNLPTGFKTALILEKNQKTESDLSFAETVGFNRGVTLKVFYDKEVALQWLDKS